MFSILLFQSNPIHFNPFHLSLFHCVCRQRQVKEFLETKKEAAERSKSELRHKDHLLKEQQRQDALRKAQQIIATPAVAPGSLPQGSACFSSSDWFRHDFLLLCVGGAGSQPYALAADTTRSLEGGLSGLLIALSFLRFVYIFVLHRQPTTTTGGEQKKAPPTSDSEIKKGEEGETAEADFSSSIPADATSFLEADTIVLAPVCLSFCCFCFFLFVKRCIRLSFAQPVPEVVPPEMATHFELFSELAPADLLTRLKQLLLKLADSSVTVCSADLLLSFVHSHPLPLCFVPLSSRRWWWI